MRQKVTDVVALLLAHAGTDRIVLGATAWRDGSVPVVHLNGLPHVRQEWRKRLRSRTTGAG
ncbi:hypothetical protein AB0F52_23005 [Amycolatopsis sp. NPDC024027]|uniref:hypothetical protein n=1 Tax=Amycolatopsis sp. NPDC024027 TaxID=3154327 RepID=UPI0033DB1AC0